MEFHTLPIIIEPIEYLLHFDYEILFNIYFVNKYFHNAMNNRHVLQCLHKNNDIGRTFISYTFSDFVYACNHIYLTSRSKKYLNKQNLLELSAIKNDKLAISNYIEKGAIISNTFLYIACKHKNYDLVEMYYDQLKDYNICCSTGGYIDRNIDGKYTTRIVEVVKTYSLLEAYRCIHRAFIYNQIELVKLILNLIININLINNQEYVLLSYCITSSVEYKDIFEVLIKKMNFEFFPSCHLYGIMKNFDLFCLIYMKCLPYGNIDNNYALELAVSMNFPKIIQFLLDQGAKYTPICFINALSISNFELCNKIFVDLDVYTNQDIYLDDLSGVDIPISAIIYLKNRNINVDHIIPLTITFDNSDELLNMYNGDINYYSIIENALWNSDYKLIEKYINKIQDQELIVKLFFHCTYECECEVIKCYKILYDRFDEYGLNSIKRIILDNDIRVVKVRDIRRFLKDKIINDKNHDPIDYN
jgi:hypothetical protein